MIKSRCTVIAIIFFSMYTQNVYGKLRILALMPYKGKSHFDFAAVLLEELARRGHDVTVVSRFPKNTTLSNYHDISIAVNKSDGVHILDMDAIATKPSLLLMLDFFRKSVDEVCIESLSHPDVQKLLKSNDHYDLIITEMFTADCFLGFVHRFNASLVFLRTSTLSTWLTERTGCPDNPSYIPGTTSGNPLRMNLLQRLHNTAYYVTVKAVFWYYGMQCEELARKHFGKTMPSLEEIAKNASLFLMNTHFVHQYPKPLMPNVKDIAGLHVRDAKPLPQDLENWISAGHRGAIYFSLGSMLKATATAAEKRRALLRAFGRLHGYRVLMKWNEEVDPQEVPENVRMIGWAPQNDVLQHPNVKLFITHGGMLGTTEAVHAGVPMIVIPFFGDQLTNAAVLEERGVAIILKYHDISEDTMMNTIEKVLNDPGYAERAKQLSAAFHDRPIPPLEEAIYWIEYVARYQNSPVTAQLMRSPVVDLALYQYLLLDVVAVLLMGLIIVWLSLRVLVKLVMRVITRGANRGTKKKMKKS